MSLVTRLAAVADVERVAPLFDAYRQFYGLAPEPELARWFLRERLSRGESVVLLAEDGGSALGFVQMYPTFSSLRAARTFVLYDLFVDPAARQHGIGRQLMQAAADEARARGAVSLVLSTARTNSAAQRLYESLGWVRDEEFYEYSLTLQAP
jgi:ribosomal protein S18 acetylase RimI-like enzyme